MYARTAFDVVSSTTSSVRIGIGGVTITSESDYLERGQTTARDKCLFFSGLNCPGSEGNGRFSVYVLCAANAQENRPLQASGQRGGRSRA
jgi:hypothetical protein